MEPNAGDGGADSNGGQSVLLSRIALNDNKAGMEGLDRDKINKIILETSKGSRFYENELKKERQVNERIEKMLQHKAKVTEQQIQKAQAEVEKLTAELERGRELGRAIVHVDMDAFYAAVEMRDCPELKDKPMAVGSMSMLSTSNYHARRYGVRAAMPGFIAKKLCPNLVIVPLNFDKYTAVSEQVREIFADYDPHFLPMSLDEAYLDITDHLEQRQHWPESMRTYHISETKTEGDTDKTSAEVGAETDTLSPVLFEDSPSASPTFPGFDGKVEVFGTSPEEAVREMRFRIEQKTSLTASAGIAPNMMLAKVCSDKNKPNGQYRIPNERQAVMDFIQDLPVRKVSGIGKVTEKMLAALDIISCAQLGQQMAILSLLFSETSWHHFLQISLGLGSTHIERDSERKSMSTERTFGEMSDAEEQYSLCRELCHDLAKDLQNKGLKGKTVTLKLKNVNFEVKTKAFTLQCAVCTEEEIFAAAKDLLKAEIDNVSPQPLRLRLMGVRVSSFLSTDDKRPQQKSIVGFLKIASDSSSSTQPPGVFFRPEEGSVSESSVSSLKQHSETRSSSIIGEIPTPVSKLRNESEGTRRPQQQTFFQRALSRRLQQQSEQETSLSSNGPCTTTDSTISHACSSRTCAETDKAVVKTNTSLPTTNTASHITECINMQSVVKAQSSNMLQCFTCPVCFNEMKTTDLRVFNQHIDECLKGSAVDEGSTFMDVGQDVREEEKQLDKQDHVEKDQPVSYHANATDSISGTSMSLENLNTGMLTIADEGHCTTSSNAVAAKLVFEDGADCDFRTPFFKHFTNMNERRSLVPDETITMTDSGSKALKQTSGLDAVLKKDMNVSTLTCPVCNQAQDTDDLTLFNRHVDMCLNQEVLLEFREAGPPCGQSVTVLLGKAKDHERASNTRGKSKRRGSSPNPPSKKSKAISTRHTIDKFFKGNSNQTF